MKTAPSQGPSAKRTKHAPAAEGACSQQAEASHPNTDIHTPASHSQGAHEQHVSTCMQQEQQQNVGATAHAPSGLAGQAPSSDPDPSSPSSSITTPSCHSQQPTSPCLPLADLLHTLPVSDVVRPLLWARLDSSSRAALRLACRALDAWARGCVITGVTVDSTTPHWMHCTGQGGHDCEDDAEEQGPSGGGAYAGSGSGGGGYVHVGSSSPPPAAPLLACALALAPRYPGLTHLRLTRMRLLGPVDEVQPMQHGRNTTHTRDARAARRQGGQAGAGDGAHAGQQGEAAAVAGGQATIRTPLHASLHSLHALLCALPHARSLQLTQCSYVELGQLMELLADLPHRPLTALHLLGCQPSDGSRARRRRRRVQLQAAAHRPGGDAAAAYALEDSLDPALRFATGLKCWPATALCCLTELSLRTMLIDSAHGAQHALCRAVSTCLPGLRVLDLSENCLGGDALMALALHGLSRMQWLERLDLSGTCMAVANNSCSYTPSAASMSLALSRVSGGGSGGERGSSGGGYGVEAAAGPLVCAVGQALAHCSRLKHLHLRTCGLGADDGSWLPLAATLPALTSLTDLDLSGNALDTEAPGQSALLGALSALQGLRRLGLAEVQLQADGSQQLLAQATALPCLSVLELRGAELVSAPPGVWVRGSAPPPDGLATAAEAPDANTDPATGLASRQQVAAAAAATDAAWQQSLQAQQAVLCAGVCGLPVLRQVRLSLPLAAPWLTALLQALAAAGSRPAAPLKHVHLHAEMSYWELPPMSPGEERELQAALDALQQQADQGTGSAAAVAAPVAAAAGVAAAGVLPGGASAGLLLSGGAMDTDSSDDDWAPPAQMEERVWACGSWDRGLMRLHAALAAAPGAGRLVCSLTLSAERVVCRRAMAVLLRVLQLMPCLRDLHLDGGECGDAGAGILAAGISQGCMPALQRLVLPENRIGPAGAAALVHALAGAAWMVSMKELCLDDNQCGNARQRAALARVWRAASHLHGAMLGLPLAL